jgi:alanine racemase
MRSLSGDPSKRILGLKEVLENNLEPISRHFAFAELEEIYYHYKEVFPDALMQYDEIADKHNAELETSIREAMINKWGKLPNLVVHKKSAIRHSKSKDFEKALDWAKKGLEIYGEDAFREEWTLDLQKRVVTLTARIEKLKSSKKDQ